MNRHVELASLVRGAVAALCLVALGCAGDPPPPQQAPVDTAAAVEPDPTPPPPAPQAAPSKIGQLPLLRRPPDEGKCRFTGSDVEPRWAYESDEFPKRTLYAGEGAEGRGFRPTFLEIRATQMAAGGVDDTETLYVLFGADGRIETGTRQYFNSATPPVRESSGLLPGDTAALRDLASFVVQKCKQPAS